MAKLKTKSWRRLGLIVVVVAALWGLIGWKSYEPLLGLDLQGGISIVLDPKEGQPVAEGALEKAVDIIRERVDAFGVAEPDIATQGDSIVVQLAGIQAEDQDRAFALIGSTAKLRFRPVMMSVGQMTADMRKQYEPLPNCRDRETYPEDVPTSSIVSCYETEPGRYIRLLLGPTAVDGESITGARALPPVGSQLEWVVSLELNGQGRDKFKAVTGQLACNKGRPPTDQLAIVLDGVVQSAPQMGDEVQCNVGIPDAIISGGFTEGSAKDLALVLRYGALPVELEPSSTTTVSPTLGKASLRNGLLASVIGVGVVFLYVFAFYRALGMVIWLGILLHAAVTFAVIILLGQLAGFSLSLAGIAGLIVSLGIAADSFIVYFERIKDEVATGKPVRSAVERAWTSARRTIIAADLVTALAATVLYLLAVGSVRGFALMLGLSTLLDIAVSFLFMHPIVYLLGQTRVLKQSKTLGAASQRLASEGAV